MRFVQSQGVGVGAGTTLVKAFDNDNAVSDLIIVALRWTPNTRSVSSVVDSQGNVYQAVSAKVITVGVAIQIWYAMNVKPGPNTVTATLDGAMIVGAMAILEFMGVALENALDKTASASGSGTSADSGNTAVTSEAHEMLFGLVGTAAVIANPVAGVDWTLRVTSTYSITENRNVGTGAAYAATASWTNVAGWVCQIATFVARDNLLALLGVG